MNNQRLKRNIKNLLSQSNNGKASEYFGYKTKNQSITFMQMYSQLCQQKQYQYIRDQHIKQQNRQLRTALVTINTQVDQAIKNLQPKIQKRLNKVIILQRDRQRTKTDGPEFLSQNTLQYRKKIQGIEANNNSFVLKMYKKQFKKLQDREKYILGEDEEEEINRSSIQNDSMQLKSANASTLLIANSRLRQRLQSSIEQTVDSIAKTKIVNKKIKERNKTLGNSIYNTDQFMNNMKKLQQQVNFQQKNKKKLAKKLQQCEAKVRQISKKLQQIRSQSDTAQEYLQKVQNKQRDKLQNKQKCQQLKRKQQTKLYIQKKKQLQHQNKQLYYHNLLKNLDIVLDSTKTINQKVNQIQQTNIQLKNEVALLQQKLHKIRMSKKQKLNKKKSGFMMLSNQLFSQLDIKSQHSSMPLKQHSSQLSKKIVKIKPHYIQLQTQKYSQNNFHQSQLQIYQQNLILQKNPQNKKQLSEKPIKYVNNQSST